MTNGGRIEGMISIIIPVYNIEKYLNKCLESVIGQTYKDIEIILINDGSTDLSGKICEEWREKDSRVQVIQQKNAGAAAARNAGLDVAKGEYIMFVDGDDFLSLQMCEYLVNILVNTNAQCCVCGWSDVEENGNICATYIEESIVEMTGKMALRERYINNCNRFNTVVPWGKLFRWEMWKDLRFSHGLYYEDMDIMPYLYLNCTKIVCIPEIGYFYLQRRDSSSNGINTDDKRYIDALDIRIKHIELYRNEKERELQCVLIERLLDLIITSDCEGWIPAREIERSKKAFSKYQRYLKVEGKTSLKNRIRYTIYNLFGKRGYQIFAKNN